jgi:hypothetical protein
MDEENRDVDVPGATGTEPTTQEQIKAIAQYLETAIEPLMPLIMGEARTKTIATLNDMKEAVYGNTVS